MNIKIYYIEDDENKYNCLDLLLQKLNSDDELKAAHIEVEDGFKKNQKAYRDVSALCDALLSDPNGLVLLDLMLLDDKVQPPLLQREIPINLRKKFYEMFDLEIDRTNSPISSQELLQKINKLYNDVDGLRGFVDVDFLEDLRSQLSDNNFDEESRKVEDILQIEKYSNMIKEKYSINDNLSPLILSMSNYCKKDVFLCSTALQQISLVMGEDEQFFAKAALLWPKKCNGHLNGTDSSLMDLSFKQIKSYIINKFDDLHWFLNPPQKKNESTFVTWFQNKIAHTKGHILFEKHLATVKDKLPSCNVNDAKAILLGTKIISDTTKRITAKCFTDFFPGLEFKGIKEIDEFNLPIRPAYGFLVSIKLFLFALDNNINNKYQLRHVLISKNESSNGKETELIVIGVESKYSKYNLLRKFCIDLHSNSNLEESDGEAAILLKNALFAEIYPKTNNQPISPQEHLSKILEGCDEMIAYPYLTDNFIGIAWAPDNIWKNT